MRYIYHYNANYRIGGSWTCVDGIANMAEPVDSMETYQRFKVMVANDSLAMDIAITSLSLLQMREPNADGT